MASKVKMSEKEYKQQFFFSTYNIFFIKRVTRKFHVAATTAKKCTKKCAAGAKLIFLLN